MSHATLRAVNELWLLKGVKLPFLVRDSLVGYIEPVSEAYVDGMMYGELWPFDGQQLRKVLLYHYARTCVADSLAAE